PPYGQLAILPALLAGMTGKPLAWNAPGLPYPLTPGQRMILEASHSVSAYTAVRDDQSKDYLGVEDATVVPDTGFLIADVFPKEQLAPLYEKLRQRYSLAGAYGVLHVSPATSDPEKLMETTRIRVLAENMPLILLPLGPVHGELDLLTRLRRLFPDNCQVIADNLHPLEIAAL